MVRLKISLPIIIYIIVVGHANAATMTFSSGHEQTALLELYTSEGCSSCPPADRWLSRLKNDPRLWKQVVPIAFHVDYWNYLGWADRFSKPQYSMRQRQYAQTGYARTVYTPGFFLNGREWRGWFRQRRFQDLGNALNTGDLSVSLDQGKLTATFIPATEIEVPLLLNVAVLGTDISSEINAGENDGKTLVHDFVVLHLQTLKGLIKRNQYSWNAKAVAKLTQPNAKALAAWVSRIENPTPIQAAGGWLKKD